MLKKSQTEIMHPCFGCIRLNEKFSEVLKLKVFRDLAYKSQLGTNRLSTKFAATTHSRFLHSVGVFYLTEKLLEICENKFSDYIKISTQDKESLCLAALGHDIGHTAFSHSSEHKKIKSHEERTIEYFKQYSDVINDIFGYDITARVIRIFQNNIAIKKEGKNYELNDDLDILFIFTSLLIGTIDCDRMEYITTDHFMVYGTKLDFQPIFDYITIVLHKNYPTLGFERDAIPFIENLLINRFEQYAKIYFADDPTIIEMALKQYISIKNWDEQTFINITENQILSDLCNITVDNSLKGTVEYRLAQIICEHNREHLLFKKFSSKKEFNYFMEKIRSIVGDTNVEWIKTTQKKNTLYDPSKNKIYIKDDDGVVKDITEVSYRIRNLSISYYYVMIDLDSIYNINNDVAESLNALFYDNPIEIEKKFVRTTFDENFFDTFSSMSGVELGTAKQVTNVDLYYVPLCELPNGIAMRYRKTTDGNAGYYIKLPADDGTSITKREEHFFPNRHRNDEDFIVLLKNFLVSKGFVLEEPLAIEPGISIITQRTKVIAHVFDSKVEISYDESTFEYGGERKSGNMIECELKEGDDLSLLYLSKHIKNLGFEETNLSKQAMAKKAFSLD